MICITNNITLGVFMTDKCQILALSGGGYKGLFTASIMHYFEEQTGKPIAQNFDLLAGTSIGGILALAAAFEIPMSKVIQAFKDHGESLFPTKRFYDGILTAKYSQEALIAIISSVLPKGAKLGDALHPVIIPAVNMTKGQIQMFKTPHHENFVNDQHLSVIDIALATSAAPTYFPLADVKNCRYADGGLFSNAPDLASLHEAEHFWRLDLDNIKLVSIGALSSKFSLDTNVDNDMGVLKWMDNIRLIEVMMASQQQLSHHLMTHKLGERYYRIDENISTEQSKSIGLDIATPQTTSTLLGLGEELAKASFTGLSKGGVWSHKPKQRIIRK
ncbi:MAG: patatin-like phospholipase/acyl hydrolase [Alphaproteobacteria bacterium]|jgi:patatin-like phospholipase/acyl hydrolase